MGRRWLGANSPMRVDPILTAVILQGMMLSRVGAFGQGKLTSLPQFTIAPPHGTGGGTRPSWPGLGSVPFQGSHGMRHTTCI